MNSSGIGDAYWYEWFVGVDYILDMLYPNSKIMSVTFQASDIEGIDDVIISYIDGRTRCIQVKHSRIGESLSFRDVFSGSDSWIVKMALGWFKIKDTVTECVPVLYTNRKSSLHNSKVYASLDGFWKYIKDEITKVSKLEDICISDKYKNNWNECLKELQVIGSNECIFQFLKCLCIEDSQLDIEQKKEDIINKLKKIFGLANNKQCNELYNSICGALSEWTISTRKKECIDKEEVYRKLSIPEKIKIEEHQLPTPFPFFKSRNNFIQKIMKVVNNNKYPVIFLTGDPGCGKSSIISNLANNSNSVISFRYHAFKPITPETKEILPDYDDKVTASKLWGDILDQIRLKLENKLALYEVPIRNDFLSPIQLRNHVLRLLEIIHKEEKRTICVAIDGIDHAARASRESFTENNFLKLLVPPERIPKGVCFVIAGQKAKGYKEYPDWLKITRDDVLQLNVPQLEVEDIKLLIYHHNIILANEQIEEAARIIFNIAEGNTLQCIFAIYEAIQCTSVSQLGNKLKKHKLYDGLMAYYKEIWESVISKIKKNTSNTIPYIDSKLAAYLSISKSLYNPDVLRVLFDNIKFGELEWEQVLDDLYPLVIRSKNHNFTLLHNDVRVFLKGELYNKQNVLVKTASMLADIYINNKVYINERHYEVFDLLCIANRSIEFIKIFTPEFIIEAISINQPYEQIEQLGKELFYILKNNWNIKLIMQFHVAINTLNKVGETKKYFKYIDNFLDTSISIPAALTSEKKSRFSQCERHELFTILKDIQFLIKHNAIDRASTLIFRWFNEKSLMLIQEYGEERNIEFYIDCGKVFSYVNYDFDYILRENTKEANKIYNYIAYGVLKEILRKKDLKSFIVKFNKYYSNISDVTIEKILVYLAKVNKWKEISYILKKVQNRSRNIKSKILYQFLRILCNDQSKYIVNNNLADDILFEEIDLVKFEKEENYLFILLSFIKGVNNCNIEEIRKVSLDLYYQCKNDFRYKDSFESLIISAIQLGEIYNEVIYNHISTNVLECCVKIINNIYKIDNITATHIKDCFNIRNILLKICTYCVKKTSNEIYEAYVFWLLDFITKNNNILHEIEVVLDSVYEVNSSIVRDILEDLILTKGIVWKVNTFAIFGDYDLLDAMANKTEKNISVINMFIKMAEKYELTDVKNTLINNLKRKWLLICNPGMDTTDVLQYLHLLLEHYPEFWSSRGLSILNIILRTDNKSMLRKIHREIVSAAWKCGKGEFLKCIFGLNLLDSDKIEQNEYLCIYDTVLETIKSISFTEEDLICVYGLAISGLPWRNRDTREYLQKIIDELTGIANKSNFYRLQASMKSWDNVDFNQHCKSLNDDDKYIVYFGMYIEKDKVKQNKELSIEMLYSKYSTCADQVYSNDKIFYAIELANRINILSEDKYCWYCMQLYDFALVLYQRIFQIEDSILAFFELLFQLLRKLSCEHLLFKLVFDVEKDFSIMSQVLKRLLLLSPKYEDKEWMLESIDYQIRMFYSWTDVEYKSVSQTKSSNDIGTVSLLDIWFNICLNMLNSSSIIHNESGLQGLYYLLKYYPEMFIIIDKYWDNYSDQIKIQLSRICIKFNMDAEFDPSVVMNIIDKSLQSSNSFIRELGLLFYVLNKKKSIAIEKKSIIFKEYINIKNNYIHLIYNEAEVIYNIDLPQFVLNKNWPDSYLGIEICEKTQEEIECNFRDCIHDSISENVIVLSSILHFYGLMKSYIYHYELANLKCIITNKNIYFFEIYNTPYLSQIIIRPSSYFMKKFHLKYSSTSPFILIKNGKKVMWLEIIHGTIGEEELGYFRKNTIQRWVCTKEFYNLIQKKFKDIDFISKLIDSSQLFSYDSMPDNLYIFE